MKWKGRAHPQYLCRKWIVVKEKTILLGGFYKIGKEKRRNLKGRLLFVIRHVNFEFPYLHLPIEAFLLSSLLLLWALRGCHFHLNLMIFIIRCTVSVWDILCLSLAFCEAWECFFHKYCIYNLEHSQQWAAIGDKETYGLYKVKGISICLPIVHTINNNNKQTIC